MICALENDPEKDAIHGLNAKIRDGMPKIEARATPTKASGIAAEQALQQLIKAPAHEAEPEEMEGIPE